MMARLPPPVAVLFVLGIAFSPAVHGYPPSSPDLSLMRRATTCQVACSTNFPTDFCCPTGNVCQPLAGYTTALCCPTGYDCVKIQAIPCNLTLQNPTTDPGAMIMTTQVGYKMATCGNLCCPFGYSCNYSPQYCVRNPDQSTFAAAIAVPPPAGSTVPQTTSPPATAPTPAATSAASGALQPTTGNATDVVAHTPGTPAANQGVILAVSVLSGLAVGVAALVGLVIWWRHKSGAKAAKAEFQAAIKADAAKNPAPPVAELMRKAGRRVTTLWHHGVPDTAEPPQMRGMTTTTSTTAQYKGNEDREEDEGEEGIDDDDEERSRGYTNNPYRYGGAQDDGDEEDDGDFDPYDRRFTRGNGSGNGNSNDRFSDMMEEADLGPIHRGQRRFLPAMPALPAAQARNNQGTRRY